MRRWVFVALAMLAGRREVARTLRERRGRIVPEGQPSPGAELVVIGLLLCAAACAAGFVVVYAAVPIAHQTQWLGLALGGSLLFASAAAILFSRALVVDEDSEEDYPEPSDEDVQEVEQIVRESGSRITRKRLLLAAGGLAGGSLGAALITPALSLGPLLDHEGLYTSAWRRGKRLVDEADRPYKADDIEFGTFYTAYPEHEGHDRIDAPVVVVRLDPSQLKLPADRADWAPQGLLAYSKVCTHAGCAIALYRKPTFAPTQPRPALVCPCHYSTFDPAAAGAVIFGPAGRPLPQLPLMIDRSTGELRAGGVFSGPIGPSWSGVRDGKTRYEPSGPEGVE